LSFNFKNQHYFEELWQLIPIEKQELLNSLVSLYDMKKESKVLNKTGNVKAETELIKFYLNYLTNKNILLFVLKEKAYSEWRFI